MLRVGLTGGLGSGKSTVASFLRSRGAHVLSSDDLGRQLMQPGQSVYDAIVHEFGPEVLLPDAHLNRPALARLAFTQGKLDALNRIVHPAVIARQEEFARKLARTHPEAVLIVESALLFETRYAGPDGWRKRFDCIVLVTAPPDIRIERYVERVLIADPHADPDSAREEARRRLAQQIPDEQKLPWADFVLRNETTLAFLELEIHKLWPVLVARAGSHAQTLNQPPPRSIQ